MRMHETIRTSGHAAPRDGLGARLRRAALPVACLCIMGYFGYHAVHGDHGLVRLLDMREARAALEQQVAAARDVRMGLEHDVALLRRGSLDPDLLDERARVALGFAHPDELIIFTDQ